MPRPTTYDRAPMATLALAWNRVDELVLQAGTAGVSQAEVVHAVHAELGISNSAIYRAIARRLDDKTFANVSGVKRNAVLVHRDARKLPPPRLVSRIPEHPTDEEIAASARVDGYRDRPADDVAPARFSNPADACVRQEEDQEESALRAIRVDPAPPATLRLRVRPDGKRVSFLLSGLLISIEVGDDD